MVGIPYSLTAAVALLAFPILCVVALAARRGSPTTLAFALVLAGDMFLPQRAAIDLPLLPSLDGLLMPWVGVLAGLCLGHRRRLAAARPGRGLEALVGVMVIGVIATLALNQDTLRYGPTTIHGVPLYDLPTGIVVHLLRYGVPFFLGRALVRGPRELRQVLTVLALAGLVYSVLCLVEVRLSPQLHRWVYGYHPTTFMKSVRWGGYRPMVFMESGIAVGIFMATTLTACAGLAKAGVPLRLGALRLPTGLAALYLAGVLVIGKSTAAIVQGIGLALAIAVLGVRNLQRLAVVLALLVIFYPAIRLMEVFPEQELVQAAAAVNEERASSLQDRFENEDAMLAKWRERPVFGWGTYQRYWVFDPETGDHLTVPDGYWIIQIGKSGLVGFLTAFALYVVPILRGQRRLRRFASRRDRLLLVTAMLVVGIQAVDQLHDGFYASTAIFMAGALWQASGSAPPARARRRRASRPPAPEPGAPAADPTRGGRGA